MDSVDFVVVTISDFAVNVEICREMENFHYPMEKVLFIYNCKRSFKEEYVHKQDNLLLRHVSMQIYDSEVAVAASKKQISTCLYDPMDANKVMGTGKLANDPLYLEDYSRYRTFKFVAEEINGRGWRGPVQK